MAEKLPKEVACRSQSTPGIQLGQASAVDYSRCKPWFQIEVNSNPSLRVIRKNIVQKMKEEFEKKSTCPELKPSPKRQQIKSDSCIRFSDERPGVTRDSDLGTSNAAHFCTLSKQCDLKKPAFSSEKGKHDGCLSIQQKPPIHPKPGVSKQINNSVEFLSSYPAALRSDESECFDDNQNCITPHRFLEDQSETLRIAGDDIKLRPAGVERSCLSNVHQHCDILTMNIPPKPPRCLSEVSPEIIGKHIPAVGGAEAKYDCLTNTTSVVMRVMLPEQPLSEEPVSQSQEPESLSEEPVSKEPVVEESIMPSDGKNKVKLESQYEEITDVVPKSHESKKWKFRFLSKSSGNSEKKKKRNKAESFDNPGYMCNDMKDDTKESCSLVRHLSCDALDHETISHQTANPKEEQRIYDEPYVAKSRLTDTTSTFVAFDEGGYAIPDLENQTFILQAQLMARSKVSNAYSVLRLPHETGDSSQIDQTEDVADEDVEEQEKRLHYVKSVRNYTSAAIAKYEQVKLKSGTRLFQYGLIVGLESENDKDIPKPKVLFCIPPKMEEGDSFVCNFCFPDSDILKPLVDYEGEMFSFVLTSAVGDRRYGWCKRYLPPGRGPRLPEAICIVSTVGEFGMYEQLLRTWQDSRMRSMDFAVELIEVAYARPLPAPGKEVYIRTVDPDQTRQTIKLKRASDSACSCVAFSELLQCVPFVVLIQIFGSLLLERKVVICSSGLSTLSSFICSLVALLYPFEWQHTFLTVLPSSLIDIVQAPTPFIVGILNSMKSYLEDLELSEVLIVDLDTGSIVSSVGDESRILPKKIQKALIAAVTEDLDVHGSPGAGTIPKPIGVSDATISEAFLRMFIETCAHYGQFITRPDNDEATFQRELFVKAVHSRSIRMFLDWFTQTQMFEVFISGRLHQSSCIRIFDQRIAEYQEEMETTVNKHKSKSVGNKLAKFIRESSVRIKQTFQRKVYI